RLGFVGIDDEEARAAVLALLGHEAPLHAGREACTAAPTKAGSLHFLDDLVLAAGKQRLRVIPIATRARSIEIPRLEPVEVGKDAVLVSQHRPSPSTTSPRTLKSRVVLQAKGLPPLHTGDNFRSPDTPVRLPGRCKSGRRE